MLSDVRCCQVVSYQVSYCRKTGGQKGCKVGRKMCWTYRTNCVLVKRDMGINLGKWLSKATELGERKNVKMSKI